MTRFRVDSSLCTRCGLCAKDCVARIIEWSAGELPSIPTEKDELCLKCQHCLAVCPSGAVSVLGLNPADSQPIDPAAIPTLAQMDHFIRSRRSIRHYRDENVDPALLDSLMKTLAHAPTGVNAQELVFHLIDDRAVMDRLREKVMDALTEAARASGSEQNPFLERMLSMPREAAISAIFRGAPHALIVSAPLEAPCAAEDVSLALAYFELLAQSAGLGTVWWGYLRRSVITVPALKPVLGIPEDHVYYAMLFGYPSIKFARTAQHDDAAQVRRIEL